MINHIKNWGLAYLVLGVPLTLFIIISIINLNKKEKIVHWHIPISYNICGNKKPFFDEGLDGLIHGHNDNKIHIEGKIDFNNRKETLGKFFDSFNMKFNDTQIANIKNGFKCPGSKQGGTLIVKVNGKKINNVRNYILSKNDNVEIIFK